MRKWDLRASKRQHRTHRQLRFKLARFADNPEELADSYKRESLRDMCREAGIWRSGNDAIIDVICEAWQKLIAQPETITSIGKRQWAHIGQCQ